MPTTGPNLGLNYEWTLGESGWNVQMDDNLISLDGLVLLNVLSATTTAQPASPTAGDRYLLPTSSTGAAWSGNDGKIAIFRNSLWNFFTAKRGWEVTAQDTGQRWHRNASAWGLWAANLLATQYASDSAANSGGVPVNGWYISSVTGALKFRQGTGAATFNIADNTATAFNIAESTNDYIKITTTNSAEKVIFGNTTTNPDYEFLGSGTFDAPGISSIAFNATLMAGTLAFGGEAIVIDRAGGEAALHYYTSGAYTGASIYGGAINGFRMFTNGNERMRIDHTDGLVTFQNNSYTVGNHLFDLLVEANTAGSGSPNILTAAESGTVLTNEGTTAENYHTLPLAVAGLHFDFIVQDTDGIRIVANTGDTIRTIAGVSASAGFIRSATIGATVTLVAINATEWIATSINGTWTIDV